MPPHKSHSELLELAETLGHSFRSKEEVVATFLRQAIVTGVFAPGDRLPQDQIAEVLGISRIPIRAALRQLESEGLIKLKLNRGALVKSVSAAEVEEIFHLRQLLELDLLRSLVGRLTPEVVASLRELAAGVELASTPGEWLERRDAYYDMLYSQAGKPRTHDLVRRLRAEVGPYWLTKRLVQGKGIATQHAVLISHLADGNESEAVAWLENHLEQVSKEIMRLIEARRLIGDS